jgi:hypothetical protein
MNTEIVKMNDWKNSEYSFTVSELQTTPDYAGKYGKKIVGFDAEGSQWTMIVRCSRQEYAQIQLAQEKRTAEWVENNQ